MRRNAQSKFLSLAQIEQLEKDYKERLKNASRKSRGSGKSTGGGTTVDETTTTTTTGEGEDSGTDAYGYDREIVEIRIKEINDKWKLEVDRLENEKVHFFR